MDSFILEVLTVTGWRRGGVVHWTLDDAVDAANKLIRRRLARRVRVLRVIVELNAVTELPQHEGPGEPGPQVT